jgi:flagellar hook protein FlgE
MARVGRATVGADGTPVDDGVDLTTQAVSMVEARQQFEANARVLRTSDDMQKGLLDLLA